MERFLQLYQESIVHVLQGWDRVLFQGLLMSINFAGGLEKFLVHEKVRLKDFGAYAKQLSAQVKAHAEDLARQQGRPFVYLRSPSLSKEDEARAIQARDGIREGLIAVFSCVEPCRGFELRSKGWLRLQMVPRQCLHLYFYYADRELGLMHIRLQTWLPFTIQVCLNGREYLARQLDREGIDYEQRDNAFVRIDNPQRAQELLERLVERRWQGVLDAFARRVLPFLHTQAQPHLRSYYWTMRQSEFATDLLFTSPQALRDVYTRLVDHAVRQFSCEDILRFLGRRTNNTFRGQVTTDLKARVEGIRLKHRVEENSIKMYDKHGIILRIETTINNPQRFRTRRWVTRHGKRCLLWAAMRKGIADGRRRAEVSRAANGRYLEALTGAGLQAPVHRVLDPVSRSKVQAGRSYRALRPCTAEETRIFRVLLNGRFALHGFRNQDVRGALQPTSRYPTADAPEGAGRVTRLLRLLRVHGVIRKVPKRSLYRVTRKGHELMTTALRLRATNVEDLAA